MPTNPLPKGSVNVSVNMSQDMAAKLKALAKASAKSRNAYIAAILTDAVKREAQVETTVSVRPKRKKKINGTAYSA